MSQHTTSLSVILLSYNSALTIEDSLLSILEQHYDENFELVIYDDASSDNSKDLIEYTLAKYQNPKIEVKKIFSEVNQKNSGWEFFYNLIANSSGEFIAFLDGDDLWTDRYKLQKQISYLNSHPECSLVASSFIVVNESNKKINEIVFEEKKFTCEDLFSTNLIGTLTCVVRKSCLPKIDMNLYNQLEIGDYPVWLLILDTGYGFLMKESMAAYRIHSDNFFANRLDHEQLKHAALLFAYTQTINPHGYFNYLIEYANQINIDRNNLEYALTNLRRYTNQFFHSHNIMLDFPHFIGQNRLKASIILLILSIKLFLSNLLNSLRNFFKLVKR